MDAPQKIELVGQFLALRWHNGKELFLDAPTLRANSPSAEHTGETDIFGIITGGCEIKEYEGVSIKHFERVGNYAVRIVISDGHGSGIYSWDFLSTLVSKE